MLGVYHPLPAIAEVCKRENLQFHIDASWGGAVVFSPNQKHKMAGSEYADSLTFNPHKMLGVPLTCSFLLTSDLRKFKEANTIPASYWFHRADSRASDGTDCDHGEENLYKSQNQTGLANGLDLSNVTSSPSQKEEREHHPIMHPVSSNNTLNYTISDFGPLDDLGDLTLQCGRKGDSLKLFLGWPYYGTSYYGKRIDEALSTAAYLASLVAAHPHLTLLSECPPPCLQVCFRYAANRKFGGECGEGGKKEVGSSQRNTCVTKAIAKGLVERGFMVDYAPREDGMFLRAVVHLNVRRETVERLIQDVVSIGDMMMEEHALHQ